MNEWLIGLARDCGKMALDFLRDGFEVEIKPDGSPVTSADIAIDRYIHRAIKAKYPSDCVLSEETKPDPNRLEAQRVWIADPIDGTSHFASRRDGFGTLIALTVDGEAVECAACFPKSHILLYAERSEGAFVNKRPVKVSSNGPDNAKVTAYIAPFDTLHSAPFQLRNNATAVFKVVTGELEGCIAITSPSTGEHDYAWASCAVEAAGGKLTDLDGNPLRYNKPDRELPRVLVCSNGIIHDALLEKANTALKNAR